MDLNYAELQLMYGAMKLLRDNIEDILSKSDKADPEHNNIVDNLKHCNSVLRKLKLFMKENDIQLKD